MKKNGFIFGLIAAAIVLQTVIMGCVVFDKTLMDPDVPVNEHAVLYFDSAINNAIIDGDDTKSGYHSPLIEYDAMVMLTPGTHTINARYATRDDVGDSYRDVWTGYTTLTYDFQAGEYYYMYGATSGGQIIFRIIKDADSSRIRKGEKKRKSVAYPKTVAPAVINNKLLTEASVASTTKFEGSWNRFTFRGNMYVINDESRGTFEFSDTMITLNELQTFGSAGVMGFLQGRAVWTNRKKPKQYVYTYSFISPSQLTLSLNGKEEKLTKRE